VRAKQLGAKELVERLQTVLRRVRERLDESDWDVLEEAIRRVHEHEVLLAEVIPELRTRLATAEAQDQ
jgi:hypothetical protein